MLTTHSRERQVNAKREEEEEEEEEEEKKEKEEKEEEEKKKKFFVCVKILHQARLLGTYERPDCREHRARKTNSSISFSDSEF